MKINKKIVKITLVSLASIVIVVIAAIAGFLVWLDATLCGEENTSSKISPDHRKTAIVEVVNCGATTAFNTKVKIHRNGWFLFADKVVFLKDHETHVKTQWVDDHTLKILIPDFEYIYQKKDKFEDIRIIYEE